MGQKELNINTEYRQFHLNYKEKAMYNVTVAVLNALLDKVELKL